MLCNPATATTPSSHKRKQKSIRPFNRKVWKRHLPKKAGSDLSKLDGGHYVNVSKYGVFSASYFPVFGLKQENKDQKKLRILTFFTQTVEFFPRALEFGHINSSIQIYRIMNLFEIVKQISTSRMNIKLLNKY